MNQPTAHPPDYGTRGLLYRVRAWRQVLRSDVPGSSLHRSGSRPESRNSGRVLVRSCSALPVGGSKGTHCRSSGACRGGRRSFGQNALMEISESQRHKKSTKDINSPRRGLGCIPAPGDCHAASTLSIHSSMCGETFTSIRRKLLYSTSP